MKNETIIIQQLTSSGILPLFYHDNEQVCLQIIQSLYQAGLRCVEFTNRGVHALPIFAALCLERDRTMPGLLLGAGTIKTGKEATDFISAGADFLVSPFFDISVSEVALQNKIVWMPGCMTPREIHLAELAGCKYIKLFPGNILGFSFLESIKPLFPHLHFMVTGGIDTSDEIGIKNWFKTGIMAVGMGSTLISKKLLAEENYQGIIEQVKYAMTVVAKNRIGA